MKTLDQYFADWEASVFGYGYGSGEEHVLGALKTFMECSQRPDDEGRYDYAELEARLSPATAWLLINALCHADIIEYGTSPRYGWLTPHGEALKRYVDSHSVEELCEATEDDENICYPEHCNCEGEMCNNPFWRLIRPRTTNKTPC